MTPCMRWEVSVDNEFSFPVSVFLYAGGTRAALGAVFPGTSRLASPDSGQITFSPPLGMSLIARGKQIRGVLRCVQRVPV